MLVPAPRRPSRFSLGAHPAAPTVNPAPGPTVAAVLSPAERSNLDAASAGCFTVLHRDSLPDALQAVRERAVDAVVLSVHQCAADRVELVDRLVRGFPGIPTVALVSRHDPLASEMLLRLGATGVREVVDVTGPAGWSRLRRLVVEPASRGAARILAPLSEALPALAPDARLFLELLVRLAPHTPAVRTLADRLRIKPSTLMSRFTRAGLPSPKTYLAAVRVLYAAQYLESDGLSIADVAYRLECSSPQSFGRSLRAMLGITPGEFRRRFPFPVALQRFLATLVTPYDAAWVAFRPLDGREGRAD